MSDWSEEALLQIHRSIIVVISISMTSIYCSTGHSICRPQPILFYLSDSWQEIKFHRDAISLIFVSCFVATVTILQIFIEIKKHKVTTEMERAAETAEAAKRNMDRAKVQFCKNETLENIRETNVRSATCLPNEVTDTESSSSIIDFGQFLTIISNDFHSVESHHNTLKVARAVTFCTIVPMSVFIILFTLENIDEWRPHAVLAATMVAFGVIVPILIFIVNVKMRKFAANYFRQKWLNLKELLKFNKVEPVISTII